jgi:hypothetical protein
MPSVKSNAREINLPTEDGHDEPESIQRGGDQGHPSGNERLDNLRHTK